MPATFRKHFSSLFSVEGARSNELYRQAVLLLGLEALLDLDVLTVEKNCSKILIKSGFGKLKTGPENSYIINVPAEGNCWLIAILAPLIGFVVDERDELGIVQHVRETLSEIVLEDPENFSNLFESGVQGVIFR